MRNPSRLLSVLILLALPSRPAFSGQDPKRTLTPLFLGLAVAVSPQDGEALDKAGRADVTALCPAGGTDSVRRESITPFRGVKIGPISRDARSPVAELMFPYGYDALYTALMLKACAVLRLIPSAEPQSEIVGDVPIMTEHIVAPEESGPGPLAPREYSEAVAIRVEESQTRFVKTGDKVDLYFVCPKWPPYMRNPKKEWVSIKPANHVRVLDVSRKPYRESVTLELDSGAVGDIQPMIHDCSLFLARRAPGDESSAGMTGVTLTRYGFDQLWPHWAPKPKQPPRLLIGTLGPTLEIGHHRPSRQRTPRPRAKRPRTPAKSGRII